MNYTLIQTINGSKPCKVHKRENLVDVYHNNDWKFEAADVDKLKFTCTSCNSVRVYKINPEKVILSNEN